MITIGIWFVRTGLLVAVALSVLLFVDAEVVSWTWAGAAVLGFCAGAHVCASMTFEGRQW